jgi:hypothetical protein
MSHRAAIYTVRVRPRRDTSGIFRPLGDIDDNGVSLLAVIDAYMLDFESTSADGSKVVRCENRKVEGDELLIIAQNGQKGVASDLMSAAGTLRVHRTADDTELVRCGALLRLPPAKETGWLAAHINNQHGIKGLLDKELSARFRQDFPGLVLEITPCVLASALREAIEHDRVDKVKLVKLEQPNDRANAATDKWVRQGIAARIELQIKPAGRLARVLPQLLRQYVLDEDHSVFGQIVEFEGLTFDEAKVEVVAQNGAKRTFNIEKPDTGHPVTEDLGDLVLLADGEPDETSLFAELRAALTTVGA